LLETCHLNMSIYEDNLNKEEKPYEEIINSEFSIIQENKNNEVNPRSHG